MRRSLLRRVGPRVRKADEFGVISSLREPSRREPLGEAWTLPGVRAARTEQLRGRFARPVALATALRTDDAIYTAYHNRLAPLRAVASELQARETTKGRKIHQLALDLVRVPLTTLVGIAGTLVDHGIAVGYLEREEIGGRLAFRLREWPLEHVEWSPSDAVLYSRTRDAGQVPIVHGDGQWVVFRGSSDQPWSRDAAILATAFVGFAHGECLADWGGASRAHGLAKIVGELPEGVSLVDAEGGITPEAEAFRGMLSDLASGDASAGIRPAGAKSEFLANGSTAWQVFKENSISREKAAARIYLGTDAMLGSAGGAPGVDISTLFGVASTKIQGDLDAIHRALDSGVHDPWTAINFGDSQHAPRFRFLLPDPDVETRREQAGRAAERLAAALAALRDAGVSVSQSLADRLADDVGAPRVAVSGEAPRDARARAWERLTTTLSIMRDGGLEVTQTIVDALAHDLGVARPVSLQAANVQTSSIELAPTDVAKVVTVAEARAAQGLPPFGDDRDAMTIGELTASLDAPAPAP